MTVLSILWFVLAAVLFAVYAVADGFDLGAGMTYAFMKTDEGRGKILAAISPIWNGNEVWLLAAIGSLLAAFPPVYAALLSSMYVPVMLVLVALIFRATGIELRGKAKSPALGKFFDVTIAVGSFIPAWAIGLVAGNVLIGFPLEPEGVMKGNFLAFLNPFALLASLASLAAFGLHGLLFLAMKSDNSFRENLVRNARRLFLAVAVTIIAGGAVSPAALAGRFASSKALPFFWVFACLAIIGYVGVWIYLKATRYGLAFASSGVAIASLCGAAAALLYPALLPSSLAAANDLTVANSASSDSSLLVMLVVTLIALPLIAVYTFVAYRSFRGKTVVGKEGSGY
jgi:cytochrome bd ubiquinol oxidase subunit II